VLHVGTKLDLRPSADFIKAAEVLVCAHSGRGLDELSDRLAALLGNESRGQRQWIGMTAARCQESLFAARAALARTVEAADRGVSDDLVSVELRDALEHLGHIVGAVYTDDVLDRIFSKFCIGK
jgi:tRNA modification GTPase